MEFKTQMIEIAAISVSARIRKDTNDISILSADINKHGLINPITVMDCGNGQYLLIAGLRRLQAIRELEHTAIRSTVLSPMAADDLLTIEYSENVQRKDFTVVERLEYAEKIKAVEKAKARERQISNLTHQKLSEKSDGVLVPAERPEREKGETRDVVAKKAGFSSTTQYRRVEKIAAIQPKLLDEIDTGKISITGAFNQLTYTKPTDSSAFSETGQKTESIKPTAIDQITRIGHSRLMKNPLYAQLQEDLRKAQYETNRTRAELDRKTEFFDNQVKHFKSNIDALKRQRDELLAEIETLKTHTKN